MKELLKKKKYYEKKNEGRNMKILVVSDTHGMRQT